MEKVLIKFKSKETCKAFAMTGPANAVIAKYMQRYELTAVNNPNGDIVLLEDGEYFELDGGWHPVIYPAERKYFSIEVI